MSGLGFKNWTAGDVLSAADVNGYLMRQALMVFANASARSSAIPSPSQGMVSYLQDTSILQAYGTAWGNISPEALPSQSGNAGRFLTTNGTAAAWSTITTDPNPQIFLLMGA